MRIPTTGSLCIQLHCNCRSVVFFMHYDYEVPVSKNRIIKDPLNFSEIASNFTLEILQETQYFEHAVG